MITVECKHLPVVRFKDFLHLDKNLCSLFFFPFFLFFTFFSLLISFLVFRFIGQCFAGFSFRQILSLVIKSPIINYPAMTD
ncbi:hypothetical protein BDV23DRAFT_148079 [Aspergillus alliaceus]|uniref:Uncharacterized protein n=1 Tax=Petromyces alliaceus TaxID=209559 RepID=A0A5N7CK45_PETAA|nr:hypothetical protein BDV23DRAFT_148079 [Aspergillus alliaceus]